MYSYFTDFKTLDTKMKNLGTLMNIIDTVDIYWMGSTASLGDVGLPVVREKI